MKDLEVANETGRQALEFEKAALIRDKIMELRKEMVIEEGQLIKVKGRRS